MRRRAMKLAEFFRKTEVDVPREPDRADGLAEALGAPPEEAEEDDPESETSGRPRGTRRGTKVPFRMLRHTLYLLMGQRQDRYYGKESDIRDLAFRLAFACGMNRQGDRPDAAGAGDARHRLQNRPRTAVRLLCGPAVRRAGKTDPAAYAAARLAQRVYALRRESFAEEKRGRVPAALEATFYIRQKYHQEKGWQMSPGAFLNWLGEREIPAQDCETLLSRSHDARQMLAVLQPAVPGPAGPSSASTARLPRPSSAAASPRPQPKWRPSAWHCSKICGGWTRSSSG